MPPAPNRTRTSLGPGSGTSLFSKRRSCAPWMTQESMAVKELGARRKNLTQRREDAKEKRRTELFHRRSQRPQRKATIGGSALISAYICVRLRWDCLTFARLADVAKRGDGARLSGIGWAYGTDEEVCFA